MTVMLATDDGRAAGNPPPEFVARLVAGLPTIRRFVGAAVADPGLREDVVQEALLRACRSWRSFDAARPMAPWLRRLAEVSAGELAGRAHRIRAGEVHEMSLRPVVDPSPPGSDDHVAALDRDRAVREALDALTPRERALLWRRDVERLPFEVVAALAGGKATGARMAVSRARRSLRVAYLSVVDGGRGCLAGFLAVLGRWRSRLANRAELVLERLGPLAVVPAVVAVAAAVSVPVTVVRGAQPVNAVSVGSARSDPSVVPAPLAPAPVEAATSTSTSTASPPPVPLPVPVASVSPNDVGAAPSPAGVRAGPTGAAIGGGGEQQTEVTPETDAIWYQGVEVRCDRSALLASTCAVLRATPVGDGLYLTVSTEPEP